MIWSGKYNRSRMDEASKAGFFSGEAVGKTTWGIYGNQGAERSASLFFIIPVT